MSVDDGSNHLIKEIRFAVVMYGGVSLAIYINGVAQELYKMVRATARKKSDPSEYAVDLGTSDPNLTRTTEEVYREIGKHLNTKFIVDILSGTSAGGINAVYLAKALVNNQSMEHLKDMWVREGDIKLLINDRESGKQMPWTLQVPTWYRRPQSLLNSQRMYYKLLEALHKMGNDPGEESPYMQDLDLFVTATDLRGLPQPIRLADGVVYENRYRHVFNFRYATEDRTGAKINDFLKKDNPFLAFAARCTSSFPFAFEPMTLADIQGVLNSPEFREYKNQNVQNEWRRFYQEYTKSSLGQIPFEKIPFGDGGYLDNKPFSYATQAAFGRRSDPLVRRKLIYIEPAPEHPEEVTVENIEMRPDAFENTLAALISLPRSETIREDIQSVYERNRLIERTQGILNANLDDLQPYSIETGDKAESKREASGWNIEQWKSLGSQWAKYSLERSIEHHGPTYGVYHRLRATHVTDEITTLIARLSGFDEDSDQRTAIRLLVQSWRNEHFERNPGRSSKKASENEFLYKMDVDWRMRRLRFIVQIIDKLADIRVVPDSDEANLNRVPSPLAKNLLQFSGQSVPDTGDIPEYLNELARMKAGLDEILVRLNYYGRELHFNPVERADLKYKDESHNKYASIVRPAIGKTQPLNIQPGELTAILESLSQKTSASKELLDSLLEKKGLNTYLDGLVTMLDDVLRVSREDCDRLFASLPEDGSKNSSRTVSQIVRATLKFYFEHYDYFDQVTFPIIFGTPAGQADLLEVVRISPEEAEGPVNKNIDKRSKLMGTKLGNFGAFFREDWRVNDILWGRLDGAERIITTLLPGPAHEENRRKWIRKAHAAILREELPHWADEKAELDAFSKDDEILAAFEKRLPPDPQLPPGLILNSASRSVQIIGRLLNVLSDKYAPLSSPSPWVLRLGQLFWSLIEIATPGTFLQNIFRYWLGIFYLSESFLIVGGLLLRNRDLTTVGLGFLGITIVVHLAILWIRGFIYSKRKLAIFLDALKQLPLFLLFVTLLGLIYLGIRHFEADVLEPFINWLGFG